MKRESALGIGGFPGQKLFEGSRLLGLITRRGTYSFHWIAEDGKLDYAGRVVRCRSNGHTSTAEDAEREIVRAVGITPEEFEL